MNGLMADPRHETDITLEILDRWVREVEVTTLAIRAEIARLAEEEGRDHDASTHSD